MCCKREDQAMRTCSLKVGLLTHPIPLCWACLPVRALNPRPGKQVPAKEGVTVGKLRGLPACCPPPFLILTFIRKLLINFYGTSQPKGVSNLVPEQAQHSYPLQLPQRRKRSSPSLHKYYAHCPDSYARWTNT